MYVLIMIMIMKMIMIIDMRRRSTMGEERYHIICYHIISYHNTILWMDRWMDWRLTGSKVGIE